MSSSGTSCMVTWHRFHRQCSLELYRSQQMFLCMHRNNGYSESTHMLTTHTCWQQQKHMTQCFLTSGFSLCWAGIAITNVLVLKLPLAFCVQTASAKLHQVWVKSLLTEWMQKVMSVSVPNWTIAFDIMAYIPWRVLLIQRGMLYGWGEGQWQRWHGHRLLRVHAYTAIDK